MQPRGIRNNNPGNIRIGDPWQGRVSLDDQSDREFVQFTAPAWGIRAIAVTLITYQDKYGIVTIRKAISRWAPPVENDTQAYVEAVARKVGSYPDAIQDFQKYETMRPMVEAIIQHENGLMPYSNAELDEGLRMAGVVKTAKVTPAGAAAGTAAASGTVAAAVEGYQQAQPLIMAAQQVTSGGAGAAEWGRIIVAGLVIVSIVAALTVYFIQRGTSRAVK